MITTFTESKRLSQDETLHLHQILHPYIAGANGFNFIFKLSLTDTLPCLAYTNGLYARNFNNLFREV